MVEVASVDFDGKQDTNGQKFEHVMNSCTSESALKLITVSHLTHGDNRVGHRGSNVRSHDHVDTLLSGDSTSDQRHDDRSGGGRGLEQNGSENTNHDTGNEVRFIAEELTSFATGHGLGSRSQKLETEEEEVQEEADDTDS
jgi:hypothetical protein